MPTDLIFEKKDAFFNLTNLKYHHHRKNPLKNLLYKMCIKVLLTF